MECVDDGPGVPKESRERIFETFYRADSATTESGRGSGIGLAADDYLVKPFSPGELVARVRSHIQIHRRLLEEREKEKPQFLEIRHLRIYPRERRVVVKGEEITLTNKEFELLLLMAENPNIVFSKERLFDRIWGLDTGSGLGDGHPTCTPLCRLLRSGALSQ